MEETTSCDNPECNCANCTCDPCNCTTDNSCGCDEDVVPI